MRLATGASEPPPRRSAIVPRGDANVTQWQDPVNFTVKQFWGLWAHLLFEETKRNGPFANYPT